MKTLPKTTELWITCRGEPASPGRLSNPGFCLWRGYYGNLRLRLSRFVFVEASLLSSEDDLRQLALSEQENPATENWSMTVEKEN